jgi:hypothetical protein
MLLRLCWKEWRRGWPLLALGLLLPPFAVFLSRQQVKILRLDPVWIVIFLLMMGVVLRASTLVAGGNARLSYAAAHFPLHPAWPLLITMLCQGLLVALVGANVGWWTAKLPHELPVQTNILLLVAYFLAAFLLTISISRAISVPAAIAAGIFWVVLPIGAGDVGRRLATPAVFSYSTPPTVSWTNALLCALAGMLAFCLLLSSKRGQLPRRALAVLLVAAVAIGYPLLSEWWTSQPNRAYDENHPTYYSATFSDANATSTDGSVEIRSASGETLHGLSVSLQFTDYRSQQNVARTFPFPLQVLEISGRSAWLLGRSADHRLTLSRWDLADNRVGILLTLPARKGAFPSGADNVASFSPDGHYAVLCLPALQQSQRFFNSDLWLVDLTNRQVRLVMMHTIAWIDLPAMRWESGRVINAEFGQQISLPDGAISPWASPLAKEGRR